MKKEIKLTKEQRAKLLNVIDDRISLIEEEIESLKRLLRIDLESVKTWIKTLF